MAKHIEDAVAKGQPDVLTIERTGAKERRRAALKDKKRVPGKDLDEYPPAMFAEGGAGADVVAMDKYTNRSVGSMIGNRLRDVPVGRKVKIKVFDE